MLKKWNDLLFKREYELKERLFRLILMIAGIVSAIAILEGFFLTHSYGLLFTEILVLLTIIICAVFMIKYQKLELATIIFWVSINCCLFPNLFYLSGGISSGVVIWFVLAMVYPFIMFSGRKLVIFATLSAIVDFCVLEIAYLFPGMVQNTLNTEGTFIDMYFSIIVVGVTLGGIVKVQVHMLEIERTITLTQKEELEKANTYKDGFFANMSHEIRTPINTIVGLNEMILRETHSDVIQDYAHNIEIASKMLLNLVNDILEFSQLEMKQMQLVPLEYDSKEMFLDAINMVRIRMREKNLEFRINIDEKIPSVLYGDVKRIKQILLNILTNAIKYTNEGSITLTVDAEFKKEAMVDLKIVVADTGIGIHKENLQHIFDIFSRMDQRKNVSVEGSGLGLAITKQLVDLMGGTISIDSIYTKGSVFTITIEQRIVNSEPIGNVDFQGNQSTHSRHQYHQSFEAPEARVLIVDDSTINAQVAKKLLGATKVQVDVANSGEECLRMAQLKYYHVILMDYMMPEMNGIETLGRLRKQENGLCKESPVLALTGNILNNIGNWYVENGFSGYLEKPIEPMKLEREVLRLLPDEIVEYRFEQEEETVDEQNIIKKISNHRNKKKKVYITSDCVCDLPDELLEKYDIKLMYYYIKTPTGRFADTREIDSDNLSQYYMSGNAKDVHADSVSVEEYEEFFAEVLTQAEQVIHVVMAAHAGKSQKIAHMAAKGFDHVKIIDSGHISGGEGLCVLYAARLAQEGLSVEEICKEINRIKGKIVCRFLLPNSRVFYQNGYLDKFKYSLCEGMQWHPMLNMRHSRLVVEGFGHGRLEESWKRFIRFHLLPKWRIDTGVVVITHVCCTQKQLDEIQKEVLKYIPFKKVIIQKGSFSNACNSGLRTIGIAYYLKSN